MSALVYRIVALLGYLLFSVPVGTNLGLLHLLLALVSGRFLSSRGAVFPALLELGLSEQAVRRAGVALSYGRFESATLLTNWQRLVRTEGRWQPHTYEGIRPLACDLVGFLRPHPPCAPRLRGDGGCAGQPYQSQADTALPAVVLALVAQVGSVGKQRLALPRLLLRQEATETTEAQFQQRVIGQAGQDLAAEEALIVDAGFALADLLDLGVARFVVRLKSNSVARRNYLPAYKGHGRPPLYAERVRPLPRKGKGQTRAATPPDRVARAEGGGPGNPGASV